jgi:hypothetical protein
MEVERPPVRGRSGRAHASCRLLVALLLKPVWLPPGIYAALPWLYLGTGSAALLGGLYLPDTSWYLPYLALVGVALLRAATAIAAARRRRRQTPALSPGSPG